MATISTHIGEILSIWEWVAMHITIPGFIMTTRSIIIRSIPILITGECITGPTAVTTAVTGVDITVITGVDYMAATIRTTAIFIPGMEAM